MIAAAVRSETSEFYTPKRDFDFQIMSDFVSSFLID